MNMKNTKDTRTTKLFQELETVSKDNKSYQNFMNKHQDEKTYSSLKEFLNEYFAAHSDLTVADIIFRSNLNSNYVYPICNGKREHPSKYKMTAFCIGAHMNLRETQRSLTLAGCCELHPKNPADAGIIICINQGCDTVMEVEEFLLENGVESPF